MMHEAVASLKEHCQIPEKSVGERTRPRHPASAKFHAVLSELGALHDRKQADYGTDSDPFANVRASEDFGIPAWLGAIVRGNDKVSRIKAFANRGTLENESLEDSLKDLAVYAVIALLLYRESQERETA